jgi:hypothetical protein
MGNSVAGATGVRSLPIVGAVSGSSPFVGKRRGGLADERRAAALDVFDEVTPAHAIIP